VNVFQLPEIIARQRPEEPWTDFLTKPSLIVGLYTVPEPDEERHQPHADDEVYYVVSGRGVLHVEGEDAQVEAGTVAFVAAGQRHHFHSISEELRLLVFFARAK